MAKKTTSKKTTTKKESVHKEPPKKVAKGENTFDLWDKLIDMDRRKATKFIIIGMVIAMFFGTMALISASLADNASDWENYQLHENDMGYWRGDYGYQEFLERDREIYVQADWMRFQEAIFENIARVGVNVGLLAVMVGFIGYSADEDMDPKKRQLSFVLAAVIITVVMFTSPKYPSAFFISKSYSPVKTFKSTPIGPVSLYVVFGVTSPSSIAIDIVTVLNTDPGSYGHETTLLW